MIRSLYTAATGMLAQQINQDVVDDPSLVNSAPFEDGWLFKVRVAEEPADLLTADEYTAQNEG